MSSLGSEMRGELRSESRKENDDNEDRRLTKMEQLHLKLVEINTKSFGVSRAAIREYWQVAFRWLVSGGRW